MLAKLTEEQCTELLYDWARQARPEQRPPEGNWQKWLYLGGRGSGKLLDVDTSIATPSGWTTMRELRIGDQVFDEAGKPCNVIWVSNTQFETTYRLTFSDGAELVAGASHQWVTWTHRDRKALLRSTHEPNKRQFPENWPSWRVKRHFQLYNRQRIESALALIDMGVSAKRVVKEQHINWKTLRPHLESGGYIERTLTSVADAPGPRIRTTAEILQTLTYNKRGDLNHCIPLCNALELPSSDLPIDPYVLGAWLGDGAATSASLTNADEEVFATIEEAGYSVGRPYRQAAGRTPMRTIGSTSPARDLTTGRMVANGSLTSALRAAGVLGKKHIPLVYLRASAAQRLALLQGLMDTDGHCDTRGECEFVSVTSELAAGVQELSRTLGLKATLNVGRAKLYGRDCGARYRVLFTTEIPVFRLPRKLKRQRLGQGQQLRQHHRMIIAVDEVAPVAMRCIAVDSPHHMYLAGRAMIPTHNTRSGAEWIRSQVEAGKKHIALVGATAADARDIMVLGPAGILAVSPPNNRPTPILTRRRVEWPNGAVATLFSADEPDRLRGPSHDAAWCDEVAASWRYARDAWEMLMFGLRLGDNPQVCVTTTPRPVDILIGTGENGRMLGLMNDPGCVVTRGSSYLNRANLAPTFFSSIITQYEGTRLGRQELEAEIIEDLGGLWSRATIEASRIRKIDDLSRVIVAIDPAATSGEEADETGIIVAGKDDSGHGYVLADRSGRYAPLEWARRAIELYHEHSADRVVAEVNNGGEMVEATLRMVDPDIPFTAVKATRGKVVRAEPVAALYEQSRVHHLGSFPVLEDQMCAFTPTFSRDAAGYSPDRVDALVWALTELLVEREPYAGLMQWYRSQAAERAAVKG